jgi:hypothetical protein
MLSVAEAAAAEGAPPAQDTRPAEGAYRPHRPSSHASVACWTQVEKLALMRVIRRHLPIRGNNWQRVVDGHAILYGFNNRDEDSIKRSVPNTKLRNGPMSGVALLMTTWRLD